MNDHELSMPSSLLCRLSIPFGFYLLCDAPFSFFVFRVIGIALRISESSLNNLRYLLNRFSILPVSLRRHLTHRNSRFQACCLVPIKPIHTKWNHSQHFVQSIMGKCFFYYEVTLQIQNKGCLFLFLLRFYGYLPQCYLRFIAYPVLTGSYSLFILSNDSPITF